MSDAGNSAWSHDELATLLDGTWVVPPGANAPSITGASLDTRSLRAGQAFFAFRGEQTDGHRYLPRASDAGASLAIVEAEPPSTPNLPTLRTASSERALVAWATAHRARLNRTRVVGVTGSVGKTTTTRLIDAALSTSRRGRASIKSYNNRLGVSLTVLNATSNLDYLVCEMGMNAAGEIAELAEIARPTIGVITAIGRAHIEALGSIEAIAREKAQVYRTLGRDDVAIGPAATPTLDPHWPAGVRRVLVGEHTDATVRISSIDASSDRVSFELADGARFIVPIAGGHNAHHAAIAVAVAREFGIDDDSIAEGLARVAPPEGRLTIRQVGSVTIIDDAYNASPESMYAAITTLCQHPTSGRRIAILGDMLELGAHSEAVHREIGKRLASETAIDRCVLIGTAMAHAADAMGSRAALRLADTEEDGAIERAVEHVAPGDVVLVKASRGLRLERVVDRLCTRFEAPGPVATLGGSAATGRDRQRT